MKFTPVFKEELQMLAKTTGEPVDCFESLELWTANRNYYYEGTKLFKVSGGSFIGDIKIEWLKNSKLVFNKMRNKEKLSEQEFYHRIRQANRFAIGTLEEKAIKFIKEIADTFDYQISYKAISFSGGKDSTVVSHLVRKAFSDNGILHIFSDTTIENTDTLNFINDFVSNEKIFLLKAEPQQDFMTLVEKALLPSRIHRWCCTTVKASPIEKIIRQIVEPNKKILMFEGTRNEESLERRTYKPLDCASKIASQLAARPILDWTPLEEWIYLLSERISFNDSYRYGMRRVGCSLCPLNSSWSEYVLRKRYPILAKEYIQLLREFIGKMNVDVRSDIDDYIDKGKWKARSGGYGQDLSILAEIPEWQEDYMHAQIGMGNHIDPKRLKEYFKPLFKNFQLDYFESQIGPKSVLLLTNRLTMQCKISIESEHLNIWWFTEDETTFKQFLLRLKKQIIKYRFCAYCGGCETKCAFQAITVDADYHIYSVDDIKCIGCGDCINVKDGCTLAKSVKSTSLYRLVQEV